MLQHLRNPTAAVLALAVVASTATAQHADKNIKLHVNPRWEECSIQLHPSLTQAAWRQFTEEAGLVVYFRPLRDAKPMGAGKFELSMLQWKTGIDDATAAWNDTFVHPDSTHWLFEGSGLAFPGLTVRAGVTDRVDIGAYFTKNPNANYGFYGGQVQYALLNDTGRNWTASTRASFVRLFGPEDVDFTVLGLDLLASRAYGVWANRVSISPYVGVSSFLSLSREKSAVVNLADEQVGASQGMIGAVAQVSRLNLAVEFSSARVNSRSIKVGVTF
jgi:hypothetical protein